MSDPTLNYYVAQGASSDMTTFVPTPATPAAGPSQGYIWYATDLSKEFAYDFAGSTFVSIGGGAGSVNFSAGSTSSGLGSVVFSNSGGVTFGLNGSTITATVKTDYQTSGAYLTTAMASNRGTDFVQATAGFHGTNVSGTIASSGISVSVAAPAAGAAIQGSGTYTQNTGTIQFSNSNGVTFGLSNNGVMTATVKTDYQTSGAYLTTAMQSNAATISNINVSAGATSNNLSALTFNNGNGVTFGLAGSVITASVAAAAGAQTGISGLSAGAAAITSGTASFADSNGITWGVNGQTITATVRTDYQASGAYLTTAMASNRGTDFVQATAGFHGTNASGTIASNGISVSVNAGAGGGATLSYYENADQFANTMGLSGVIGASTSYVCPFILPQAASFSYLRFPISGSFVSSSTNSSTAATSYSWSILSTIFAVVYSAGTGASSLSLQSVASGSGGMSQQYTISETGTNYTVSYRVTAPFTGGTGFTASGSSALSTSVININTGPMSNFTGFRWLDVPFANSLPAGNYWLALGISSTNQTQAGGPIITNARVVQTVLGISNISTNSTIGFWGQATNATNAFEPGLGSFTAGAIGTTASIPLANISAIAGNIKFYFQGINQA